MYVITTEGFLEVVIESCYGTIPLAFGQGGMVV